MKISVLGLIAFGRPQVSPKVTKIVFGMKQGNSF
jgi:hypothetical protein